MNDNADRIFVKKLKEGDREALREVYEKYHRPVYGIAFKYLKNKSLAEDAVHDVFIKLWNYRSDLDSGQSLKGFLLTTAKNHVLNMIRNRKMDKKKSGRYSQLRPATENKTISELTLKNYRQVFEHFLQQLSEGKREVFELKMTTDKSNKKIAEQLGVSVNTVKSQYYKASKFIKEQLGKHTEITFE